MEDDELRFWQEVDLHLTELAKMPGWQVLKTHIGKVVDATESRVLDPNPKSYSWEKYLADTGYIKGVRDVFSAPKEVHEKVANELRRRADAG